MYVLSYCFSFFIPYSCVHTMSCDLPLAVKSWRSLDCLFTSCLQIYSHNAVSTPWYAICSSGVHLRQWHVWDGWSERWVFLWCWNFCSRWEPSTLWIRTPTGLLPREVCFWNNEEAQRLASLSKLKHLQNVVKTDHDLNDHFTEV